MLTYSTLKEKLKRLEASKENVNSVVFAIDTLIENLSTIDLDGLTEIEKDLTRSFIFDFVSDNDFLFTKHIDMVGPYIDSLHITEQESLLLKNSYNNLLDVAPKFE